MQHGWRMAQWQAWQIIENKPMLMALSLLHRAASLKKLSNSARQPPHLGSQRWRLVILVFQAGWLKDSQEVYIGRVQNQPSGF